MIRIIRSFAGKVPRWPQGWLMKDGRWQVLMAACRLGANILFSPYTRLFLVRRGERWPKQNLQMGSKLLALSEHGQYEIRYMNCVTWISSPSSGEPSGQTRGLGEYDVYCIVVG